MISNAGTWGGGRHDKALAQTQAAQAQAKAAQTAAKAKSAAASKDKQIYLIAGGSGVALLLIVFGAVTCNQRLTQKLREAELGIQAERLKDQERELLFHRNWRVKESEVELESKLASGAEGEVWKGLLHGHPGNVALKKVFPASGPDGEPVTRGVWDEREGLALILSLTLTLALTLVAFLMGLQHEKLVHFIGAGEMSDETWGHVTFCVQGSASP